MDKVDILGFQEAELRRAFPQLTNHRLPVTESVDQPLMELQEPLMVQLAPLTGQLPLPMELLIWEIVGSTQDQRLLDKPQPQPMKENLTLLAQESVEADIITKPKNTDLLEIR